MGVCSSKKGDVAKEEFSNVVTKPDAAPAKTKSAEPSEGLPTSTPISFNSEASTKTATTTAEVSAAPSGELNFSSGGGSTKGPAAANHGSEAAPGAWGAGPPSAKPAAAKPAAAAGKPCAECGKVAQLTLDPSDGQSYCGPCWAAYQKKQGGAAPAAGGPPKAVGPNDLRPTPEELADPGKAMAKIWDLDVNRLTPGVDYKLDLGRGKKPYQEGDQAPNPLFADVQPSVFAKPTFKLFLALLDNYERLAGIAENITPQEKAEEKAFLEAAVATPVMQYAHNYLVSKQKAPAGKPQWMALLNEIWFKPYRRVRDNDSSGFEHVFVGEEKEGQVLGMHNWIQLWIEEKAGRLNYKGYIWPKNRNVQNSEYDQVITIQFAWNDAPKPVSTSFVGVSPEFELALYTVAYLAGAEKQESSMGGYNVKVVCYHNGHGKYEHLGTAYPESLD